MLNYEATVHVNDPPSFIRDAYTNRSGCFASAVRIEEVSSMPGCVCIQGETALHVEEVLVVDLDMEPRDAQELIKLVRFSPQRG